MECEVAQDPELQQIVISLQCNLDAFPGYSCVDKKLFYNGKLVIPSSSVHIPAFMQEFHDSPMGGHSGFLRTFKPIAIVVFQKGMCATIKQYVASCEVCQCNKYDTLSPGGLLQPLPLPQQVWSKISMDFITGLPKARGKDVILVVVDRMTKYPHFFALGHPFISKDVA